MAGRGATRKMPFVAAVSLSEEGHPLFIKFSQVQQFTLNEISEWSPRVIQLECSVATDGLSCFPGVMESGANHDKVITSVDGGYANGANGEKFKWLNIILGTINNALSGS